MLNFYNVFRKIHPELANRLEELDRKMNLLSQSTNDNVLIIRPEYSKNVPEAFSHAFPEGETVFYDESKYEGNITAFTEIKIEITEDLLTHIVYDIDKIIFYLPNVPFEGVVYDKKRIRRDIPKCQFEHKSQDQDSGEYESYVIICTIEESVDTGTHFVINRLGSPS